MPLHDSPPATELLEAVREFLQDELKPLVETDPTLKTHVGIALSVIGVVERELAYGPKQEVEHQQNLASLGVTSEEDLSNAIKSGALDNQRDKVIQVLKQTTAAKLIVANPRFLEQAIKEAELAAQRAQKKVGA
jgi:hypothetical protein